MILKRMTATFGKLEREQLDLEPGLNVIEAPNESGKSTWAAFLLSMLYGIDTAQRSSRTNLPDKTKYKPWSGQPMEGSLELQWQGRPVTIQRTGSDRAPMREFSAFDSETGNTVPLTESTCGQTLIGVERSVYERSGFLSFRCMAISGDHALEARLNALVSSGEESFSYTQVEKRLRDQRNRLRHNRLGLLPQAEEELRQVRQQMETLETLNREYRELEVRRMSIAAIRLSPAEEVPPQLSLYPEQQNDQRETSLLRTAVGLHKRFGKNSLVRGMDFLDAGTTRERNEQIGGHRK